MTGYYQPDDGGSIYWKEHKTKLSVTRSRELGIETVYQERALSEQQSIWRNLFMGRELTNNGLLQIREMQHETDRLMKQVGFTGHSVTANKLVNTMSGGERQGIAIARALYFDAELIILDEPTMGLSLSETQKVLHFVDTIKRAGKSCVLIDHNIFHVYPVADRIVVLDRGKVAGEFRKDELSLEELIEWLYHVAKTGVMLQ
jgi:simple sugar transport system ATP-binding protein